MERDICRPFGPDFGRDFDPGPVDYVFNFASPARPPEYLRLAIETLRVGSVGTENTLKIAARYGVGYLHASTSECYGDPLEPPQTEEYWGHVNPMHDLYHLVRRSEVGTWGVILELQEGRQAG